MKRLSILAALVCCIAPAQLPTSAECWYDLKTRSFTPVVGIQVGTLSKTLGRWDLPIYSFAGYNVQSARAVAGFAIGAKFSVAQNLSLVFGPGVRLESGKPFSGGLLLGFDLRF